MLFIIKLYWKLFPKEKRRVCLFKESCSNYVFRKTEEEGYLSGLRACLFRFKNCNNTYKVFKKNNEIFIETKTGFKIREENISNDILNSIRATIKNSAE
jgi:hypothetical protein